MPLVNPIPVPLSLAQTNIAAVSTDSLVLPTTQSATAGVPVQYSPRIRFQGSVWDTDDAVARTVEYWWEVQPVSDTVGTAVMNLYFQRNGAGPAEVFRFTTGSGTSFALKYNATTGVLTGPDTLTLTSWVQIGSASYFAIDQRALIYASAVGVIKFTNWDANDFTRLQLGGTTSSFPALARTGAALESRLADNSASANFIAATASVSAVSLPNTGTAAVVGQLTLVAGTKTVNTTAATATALIYFQRVSTGGTIGFATTYTTVANTSFTLNSDSALDTSVYNWWIVETH